MSNNDDKPRKGHLSFEPRPGAIELIAIEKRIERLKEERNVLAKGEGPLLGRAQGVKEMDAEISRLEWDQVSVREHVQYSAIQTNIYESEKRHEKEAAKKVQERVLRQDLEAAAQPKAKQQTAEQMRAFMKAWRELGPTEQQRHASKLLERDQEREPD